jgi:hypothetical protein
MPWWLYYIAAKDKIHHRIIHKSPSLADCVTNCVARVVALQERTCPSFRPALDNISNHRICNSYTYQDEIPLHHPDHGSCHPASRARHWQRDRLQQLQQHHLRLVRRIACRSGPNPQIGRVIRREIPSGRQHGRYHIDSHSPGRWTVRRQAPDGLCIHPPEQQQGLVRHFG